MSDSLESEVAAMLVKARLRLAIADAASVGRIADRLTSVAGSSAFFVGGIEPYHNAPKIAVLGIPEALLQQHGAVSRPAARAMAEGARRLFNADIGLAATGVLGPGGGSDTKPVGLIYIAVATPWGTRSRRAVFNGSRERNKSAFARASLLLLRSALIDVAGSPTQ